ncbi:MAG: hypothetical protein IT436_00585 [Phycisphaerales bacterium]|nr:hypothetical protein [Phycisphaerales bacterium]
MRGAGRWCAAACGAGLVSGLVSGLGGPVLAAPSQVVERVNVTPQGGQSQGVAAWPGISADGRRIVFASPAGDLVDGDTNEAWDVFVRELATGQTRRVSVSSGGAQGDDDSGMEAVFGMRAAAMSTDGRWVVFISAAKNLVDGEADPDSTPDVFLHDLQSGQTTRLPGMSGAREVSIAPTGSHVFAYNGDGVEWSRGDGATVVLPGVTGRMRSWDGGIIADSYSNCVRLGPAGSTQYLFGPACMAPTDAKMRLIDLSDDGLHVLTKINYLLAGTLFESCVYGPLPPPSVEAPCIAGEEGGEVGEIRPVMSPSGYLFAHADIGTGRAVRVFERDPAGGVWRSLEAGVGGAALDGVFGDVDISDTGVLVCVSGATNLVGGDTNSAADLFIVRGLAPVREVEVELEILIDGSSGVPAAGYTAMVEGVRAALEDPSAFARTGNIAVKVGVFDDRVRGGIAWTLPACPCEAPVLAARASESGDLARPGVPAGVCLRAVLEEEPPMFEMKRYVGGRRVVLVVGVEAEACGPGAGLAAARDRALGWVDEIDAVVLDGGGAAYQAYRDSVTGPAGVGFAVAGAADYSDAGVRIREAVRAIWAGVAGPGLFCRADVNRDGLVDFTDYLQVLTWQEQQDCEGDLNEDCVVDFGDMLEFLQWYDAGC